MNRLIVIACMLSAPALAAPPNIIYILADDLGYGELGCYGQTKIKTPNIDRLAEQGMRFTQHYSGNAVCAPTRCALLTGKHMGHAYIRDNKESGEWKAITDEGQEPLADSETTVAELLGETYATGCVGKWGLGGPGTEGAPEEQGFDFFYGYLCQREAHNYYPTHLWKNGDKAMLPGNNGFKAHQKVSEPPESYAEYKGETYATDPMIDEALGFVRENKEAPFFLYYATPVPHVALQVPEDSLAEYSGQFDETPYLGQRGYLPHPAPRAAYAAMVTRMDRNVGRILDLLDELGLAENTVVMFSSDNGPTFAGGADSEFFNSAAGLSGLKQELREGGIRVPLIVRWPGKVAAGSTSDHVSAQWDFFATAADIAGIEDAPSTDGSSYLPAVLGKPQPKHDALYWERGKQQAVRAGDWKLYRRAGKKGIDASLHHLGEDPSESRDLSRAHPEVLERLLRIAEA